MSSDYRIISDLRYQNSFCDRADYPDVKMTDVRQIAEKAIATKTKWPRLEILRNRRDIDSAFKRVKICPVMCVILRTGFASDRLGIEDSEATVIFLCLTLPFGRRAIPAYFSPIGDDITLERRGFIPHDEVRDRADYFSSQLFVDDAIFFETELGRRKEMAISRREHVCGKLIGGFGDQRRESASGMGMDRRAYSSRV